MISKFLSIVLALLITSLIASTILLLPKEAATRENITVGRVIDGDTIVTTEGTHIRLLNINTPEKKDASSNLATSYMKELTNKSLSVEITSTDKYGRTLARLYNVNDYINLDLVKLGFAKKFLVSEQETSIFANAEQQAIEQGIGIWHHSQYYGCFSATIDQKSEKVKLINKCSTIFLLGWQIQDESRKQFFFPNFNISSTTITINSGNGTNSDNKFYWQSPTSIWNDDRDTLYLFDKGEDIVLTKPYGY